MKKIIGLAGPAYVGKSSLGRAIKEVTGGVILPLAAPIKKALVAFTGYDTRVFTDPYRKNVVMPLLGNKTPREAMQKFGTEFCREMLDKDIFLTIMNREIERTNNNWIIIDDVRRNNEAEMIKRQGGIVIELSREGVDYEKNHKSEMGVSDPSERLVIETVDRNMLRYKLLPVAEAIVNKYDGIKRVKPFYNNNDIDHCTCSRPLVFFITKACVKCGKTTRR